MSPYDLKRLFKLNESVDPARKQQVEHQIEELFPCFGDWGPDDDDWDAIEEAMKKRGLKDVPGNYFPVWYNPKHWEAHEDWHDIDSQEFEDGNVIYVGHYDEFWLVAKSPQAKKVANDLNDPANQNDDYGQDLDDSLTFPFEGGDEEPDELGSASSAPSSSKPAGKQRRVAHIYDLFEYKNPRYGDMTKEDELYEVLMGRENKSGKNGLDDFEEL